MPCFELYLARFTLSINRFLYLDCVQVPSLVFPLVLTWRWCHWTLPVLMMNWRLFLCWQLVYTTKQEDSDFLLLLISMMKTTMMCIRNIHKYMMLMNGFKTKIYWVHWSIALRSIRHWQESRYLPNLLHTLNWIPVICCVDGA